MSTTIVNLYGGPGTGKSTTAAYLFNRLKVAGIETGLAQEYVKKWAMENRPFGSLDEFYFLGKQIREETLMLGKVHFIVTDKPVLMDVYYSRKYASPRVAEAITTSVKAYHSEVEAMGHKHVHVFLTRTKAYSASGRYQTEEEARSMDPEIRVLLDEFQLPVIECGTDDEALLSLLYRLKTEARLPGLVS